MIWCRQYLSVRPSEYLSGRPSEHLSGPRGIAHVADQLVDELAGEFVLDAGVLANGRGAVARGHVAPGHRLPTVTSPSRGSARRAARLGRDLSLPFAVIGSEQLDTRGLRIK